MTADRCFVLLLLMYRCIFTQRSLRLATFECFVLLLLMYRCIFTQRSLRLATSARNRRKRRVEDDTVSNRNFTETNYSVIFNQ